MSLAFLRNQKSSAQTSLNGLQEEQKTLKEHITRLNAAQGEIAAKQEEANTAYVTLSGEYDTEMGFWKGLLADDFSNAFSDNVTNSKTLFLQGLDNVIEAIKEKVRAIERKISDNATEITRLQNRISSLDAQISAELRRLQSES